MISWGTKIDFEGQFDVCPDEICPVCSKSSKPVYTVEQNYFLLYWLPIFPTSRIISKVCTQCRFKSKAKKTDLNVSAVNRAFPFRHKLKYYWGIAVFAGIFSLVAWFLVSI